MAGNTQGAITLVPHTMATLCLKATTFSFSANGCGVSYRARQTSSNRGYLAPWLTEEMDPRLTEGVEHCLTEDVDHYLTENVEHYLTENVGDHLTEDVRHHLTVTCNLTENSEQGLNLDLSPLTSSFRAHRIVCASLAAFLAYSISSPVLFST